jgi:hypothetical protein
MDFLRRVVKFKHDDARDGGPRGAQGGQKKAPGAPGFVEMLVNPLLRML